MDSKIKCYECQATGFLLDFISICIHESFIHNCTCCKNGICLNNKYQNFCKKCSKNYPVLYHKTNHL